MANIQVIMGDITALNVEAVVNAAKSSLRGGSGVDGAIHAAAGKELLDECIDIGGCMTGDAKLTKGYNLKAKYIIHTVGPVWSLGNIDEQNLLAECYTNSLILAEQTKIKTIAFPCLSTGGYGFPSKLAAKIAVNVITNFSYRSVKEVILCCYTKKDYREYKKLLGKNFIDKWFK